MTNIEKNKQFGYSAFFESQRSDMDLLDFTVARVIAEYRGVYKVKNADGEYRARVTGSRAFHATSREDYPVVGDWVVLDKVGEGDAVIHDILPRKTILKRRNNENDEEQVMAVNVDTAFIVEAVGRDFNINRLERYAALVRENGIEPVAIINKIDLLDDEQKQVIQKDVIDRLGMIKVFFTSADTDRGMEELREYILRGTTYCFLGSSGVGKSSLINRLIGEEVLKVGEISEGSRRGKHTTTHREMYFLENSGIVIDNPGIREVGITDLDSGVDEQFNEIAKLSKKCKFADCTHTHEPGCAVLESVATGALDGGAHENYVKIKKESDHYRLTKREKKEKSRKFDKFIKNTKKDLGRYGHKDY